MVNHNRHGESNEPIRIQSKYMLSANKSQLVQFRFTSEWLKKSGANSQAVAMQDQSNCEITSDTLN